MALSRGPLTRALRDMLEKATGRPVGVLRVPYTENGDEPELPYVVLVPRSRGEISGPPMTSNPWTMANCSYYVKCVGKREDQAEWMADAVRTAVLDKNSDGLYNYSIIMDGQVVIDRAPGPISPGAVPIDGKLVEVEDEYVFAIQLA